MYCVCLLYTSKRIVGNIAGVICFTVLYFLLPSSIYEYITPRPNIILQLHRDLYSSSQGNIGGTYKNSDNVIADVYTRQKICTTESVKGLSEILQVLYALQYYIFCFLRQSMHI